MTYLALDYGMARTGVAVSPDGSWVFVRPAIMSRNIKTVIKEVHALVQQEQVRFVIVGHPVSMKGEITEQTVLAERFVKKLTKALPLCEVVLFDERLTSSEAARYSTESSDFKDGTIDSRSAQILLESFLSTKKR